MLDNIIEKYASGDRFRDYTELRLQRNTVNRVGFLNSDLTVNVSSSGGGVSARIYKGGSYGFASSPLLSDDGVASVLDAAERNAVFLDGRQRLGRAPFEPVPAVRVEPEYNRDGPVSQKYIIEFLAQLDDYISGKYPSLVSRSVVAPCLDREKVLVTSDGVCAHLREVHSSLYIMMTAECPDGNPVELFEPLGDFGMFDEVFDSLPDACLRADMLYEQLMHKKEGVYTEAGVKECILHPDLAGMLAHEAVGHTTEADFVKSGSVAGPNLNKQVASPIVNMVDFAHTAFGKRCPIPVYVDDEGTTAHDVEIIKDGILRGYMHNKESAREYGVAPTGNARAFAFYDEPLIRMRNTAILPGKDKLEDMISSVEDGYYFIKTGNGQADATGEFMFGIEFGYEIRHGKLGRALRSTTISGVAFDMLKTVTMLSDDMSWCSTGMCGKKQPMPVGMGGPAVKCMVNVGGR